MTEFEIQNAIHKYVKSVKHVCFCPNVHLYSWESDFISVTKAGYVHEYEVKVTKSDFNADAKKEQKHSILENGWREPTRWEQKIIDSGSLSELVNAAKKMRESRPNYFWYVVPEGLVTEEDVPEYAGLIYVHEYKGLWSGSEPSTVTNPRVEFCSVPKAAKRLHRDHIDHKQSKHLAYSLSHKYWELRISLGR